MKNFETRVYSIADFAEWRDAGLLNLSPDFQRRAVWSGKAKSYLVDTILRQKPIPKLTVSQELQRNRMMRVVVDGQQRLRAILEFLDGDVKISRAHNKAFGGRTFEQLPDDAQQDFRQYALAVDLLFNPAYEELLDIFARINTYTVVLKPQEKLNAKYLGYFKQTAFRLGLQYVSYFIEAGILSKASVTRMAEAGLASDLLVAFLGGVQTSKNIERYYQRFDDEPGNLDEAAAHFEEVMSLVGSIYPPLELGNTNWRRPVLFYTLFTAMGHLAYGLGGLDSGCRARVSPRTFGRLRIRLDEISSAWEEVNSKSEAEQRDVPESLRLFVAQSRRATTDTAVRIARTNYVCRQLVDVLGDAKD